MFRHSLEKNTFSSRKIKKRKGVVDEKEKPSWKGTRVKPILMMEKS
jgi:hypothetical protein